MYIRHLFSLAAVTVLLIFSLAASWEFALHDLLLGDAPALAAGTVAQRWEYVLIATSGALLAWSVCTPISLRRARSEARTSPELPKLTARRTPGWRRPMIRVTSSAS